MMDLLGNSPYDFVMQHDDNQLNPLGTFVHRTFNGIDFTFFIRSLKNIYKNHNGLEAIFAKNAEEASLQKSIHELKKVFFEINHPSRTTKHISDPFKGSAAAIPDVQTNNSEHIVPAILFISGTPRGLSLPDQNTRHTA